MDLEKSSNFKPGNRLYLESAPRFFLLVDVFFDYKLMKIQSNTVIIEKPLETRKTGSMPIFERINK